MKYLLGKRKINHLVDFSEQVVDWNDAVIQITTEERLLRRFWLEHVYLRLDLLPVFYHVFSLNLRP